MVEKKNNNPFMSGYTPEQESHSKVFNSLNSLLGNVGNRQGLNPKQRYEAEKQRLNERLENRQYSSKLKEIRTANKKITAAERKQFISNATQKAQEFKKRIGFI